MDAVESLLRWVVIASPDVAFDCSGSTRPDAGVVFLLRLVVGASPDVAFDCSGSARPDAGVALCLHDFASAFFPRWTVISFLLRWAAKAFRPR